MKIPHLRPLLEQFVKTGPPGCACVVARGDETIATELVGYADKEERRPIAEDALYRIFSMTKVITCVAALKLYEQGRYLLSDPVGAYLDEFSTSRVFSRLPDGSFSVAPASRPITIRDLFTMTAGITYPDDATETGRHMVALMQTLDEKQRAGQPMTVRSFSRGVAEIPLAFDPGSHWRYGMNHDVLGALIEVLSGKRFGDYLAQEIFKPLGMTDTAFRIPESQWPRMCSAYLRDEHGTYRKSDQWDKNMHEGDSFESGGGGLISTLSDYSKFARMLACGGELSGARIIGRKTIELMATNHLGPAQLTDYRWPQLAGYGYGLGVRVLIDRTVGGANASFGEYGWSGLLGSMVSIDPYERISIVYMQQMLPNLEPEQQPRLRNVVYAALT